jgi:DnaK suppressor protein
MTPKQLDQFRATLTEMLRQTVSGSLAAVHDATEPDGVQDEPGDSADEAVRTNARDDLERLGVRDAELAMKVEAALARITSGEYGVCVECGEEIGLGRLRALPWTDLCIDDAERLERASIADPSPSL